MRLCPRATTTTAPAAGLRRALVLVSLVASVVTAEKQENGLDIETTKEGECSLKAHDGDLVSMHYTGMLPAGGVFDTSHKRNQPFEFKLGEGMVIEGWDLGLPGMCIGEERTLIIPPELGYGARKVGHIPPSSTLTFETKLVAINGVNEEEASKLAHKEPEADESDDANNTNSKTPSEHNEEEPQGEDDREEEPDSSAQAGSENGECRLLGPFALIVQGGLGILALSSLVFKRWRERPRRPMKVWFFDVSKQVVGSVLLHLLNVLMSMISSEDYQITGSPKTVQDNAGRSPNPCSFYLINIAVDTTLGIPILVLFLKVLTLIAGFTPLARPRESIKSGHYGQPPHASWWMKQSMIYFIGLLLMKFCVLLIFAFLPWIALVGDWALRWTEGSEALQIVFVMFVFPLIMNALQYYIIDSIIKDPAAGGNGEVDIRDADEDDESREPLHRASEYEEGGLSPEESEHASGVKSAPTTRTTETKNSTDDPERAPLTGEDERKQ